MVIQLSNAFITSHIHPKGAELQSLKHRQTGIEYLWNGDTKWWGKHSPVLFPIVGSLINNTYYYEGKAYQLPRHGFARDKTFTVKQISDTEAMFSLIQAEDTLALYPFEFELQLHYKLIDAELSCTYTVINSGNKPLLFSLGAHPAFAVPIKNEGNYTDYKLHFNADEKLIRHKLSDGLIGTETAIIALQNNQLPLSPALFYEDAIVLKNMHSNCITLSSEASKNGLHFKFNDFPFFGIWAAKDAPFICLEPWCGIADHTHHNQQLQNKEGICTLASNQSWQRVWSVEVF